jgi:hypothetical protein
MIPLLCRQISVIERGESNRTKTIRRPGKKITAVTRSKSTDHHILRHRLPQVEKVVRIHCRQTEIDPGRDGRSLPAAVDRRVARLAANLFLAGRQSRLATGSPFEDAQR